MGRRGGRRMAGFKILPIRGIGLVAADAKAIMVHGSIITDASEAARGFAQTLQIGDPPRGGEIRFGAAAVVQKLLQNLPFYSGIFKQKLRSNSGFHKGYLGSIAFVQHVGLARQRHWSRQPSVMGSTPMRSTT